MSFITVNKNVTLSAVRFSIKQSVAALRYALTKTDEGNYNDAFIHVLNTERELSVPRFYLYLLAEAKDNESLDMTATLLKVSSLRHESEGIVSRAQAKHLLEKVKGYGPVVLDFEGVDRIGQGFADEVFRVFADSRPEDRLLVTNASEDVTDMIRTVRANVQ